MSRATSKEYLRADLAEAERMLALASGKLERSGLESRVRTIRRELDALPRGEGRNAEVVLSFSGDPTVGSVGIEARFASDALSNYQALVNAIAARRSRGVELRVHGPVPDQHASRLHVTNVVHGSFGFELTELDRVLIGTSELSDAVERSLEVLQAAKSGEKFEEVALTDGVRIREATLAFLETLRKRGAAVRIVSDRHEVRLERGEVGAAVRVVESVRVEEEEEAMPGTFGGVFAETGRFEHRLRGSGAIIHGKLAPQVQPLKLAQFTGVDCVAIVNVIRTFKAERERQPQYVLLRLEPTR